MTNAVANVPTTNGGKYVRQLCKHWSHRLDVELDGDTGIVRFPDAVVTMVAGPEAIAVSISCDAGGDVERIKGLVESHLDRFAFREAPLAYAWS